MEGLQKAKPDQILPWAIGRYRLHGDRAVPYAGGSVGTEESNVTTTNKSIAPEPCRSPITPGLAVAVGQGNGSRATNKFAVLSTTATKAGI